MDVSDLRLCLEQGSKASCMDLQKWPSVVKKNLGGRSDTASLTLQKNRAVLMFGRSKKKQLN
jgi:hypothetical protein